MKYISAKRLAEYMKVMVLLDIVILPKEEEWIRISTLDRSSTKDVHKFYISNGAGDHMHILVLNHEKAMIKGFDHESDRSPYGDVGETLVEVIYKDLPEYFGAYLQEEHMEREDVTFCIWHTGIEGMWKENEIVGVDDGGKDFLLGYIRQTAEEWTEWASDYYEVDIDEAVVGKIYKGERITEEMIRELNPERDVEEAIEEIGEIISYFE